MNNKDVFCCDCLIDSMLLAVNLSEDVSKFYGRCLVALKKRIMTYELVVLVHLNKLALGCGFVLWVKYFMLCVRNFLIDI